MGMVNGIAKNDKDKVKDIVKVKDKDMVKDKSQE